MFGEKNDIGYINAFADDTYHLDGIEVCLEKTNNDGWETFYKDYGNAAITGLQVYLKND